MTTVRVCEDPEECRLLWERLLPQECLFDVWAVRACFHDHFQHPCHFIVAERGGRPVGLLPLSWIDDAEYFGYFPGETWHGKTWLEQNRIVAKGPSIRRLLLEAVPFPLHLRYLVDDMPGTHGDFLSRVDEVGYLFHPGRYGYSFSSYWDSFSGKSRKKIGRELTQLEDRGVCFRYDSLQDLDVLFQMNLDRYGSESYFSDPRFLGSFERLLAWLNQSHMLRVTTVLIGGEIAAVDAGAVFRKSYTLLAGGVNPDFPGVAKYINLHHIEWACRRRMETVDFLCGDFGWKERFRLSGRPLFEVRSAAVQTSEPNEEAVGVPIYA